MPPVNHGSDDSLEKEVQKPNSAEALSWLQRPGDTWSSLSGGDSNASALVDDVASTFVQHIYDLGAMGKTEGNIP